MISERATIGRPFFHTTNGRTSFLKNLLTTPNKRDIIMIPQFRRYYYARKSFKECKKWYAGSHS